MPPSRSMRTDDEMSVQEPATTHVCVAHPSASETIPSDVPVASVELEDSVPTTPRRFPFKRPPNPLDRVEPPKRTRGDEDDLSAFSASHHDLKKVSEKLKNGNGVFNGTRIPDMLDSAWLEIKTPAETSKNETLTESQSVEPLQKDVGNLLVTISFSLDEETNNKTATIPIQKQPSM